MVEYLVKQGERPCEPRSPSSRSPPGRRRCRPPPRRARTPRHPAHPFRTRRTRVPGRTSSRRRTSSRSRRRCSTPGPRSLGQGRPTLIAIRGGKQYTQGVSSLIAGGVLTALLAIALGPARGYAQGAPGPIPADPNLKVAFIGDSGNGSGFRRVLQLIKAEGAHMVLHQGDFDYADNARRFFATIDIILGDDFA